MTLVKKALEIADEILDNPDIPANKVFTTINTLTAYYVRLKNYEALASGQDKEVYRQTAAGIKELVGALKYTAKAQTNDFGFGTYS